MAKPAAATGGQRGQWLLATVALLILCGCTAARARELPLNEIRLPPGFTIAMYADNVPGARSLAVGARGTVFVGSRGAGKVYALVDSRGAGRADKVYTIASGLDSPNGVAFRDGALYVAEIHRVVRFDNIEARLANPPQPVVVNDSFSRESPHGWKFIRFGPDGRLYVPVGAPCNVCESKDPRFAGIMRMNPDGSGLEIFASGVRNTVGFDWQPDTKELWFTDNGRDWLGDNLPPDELNRAPVKGLHFGFPYRYGKNVPDPKYGQKRPSGDFTPTEQDLGPHVASLGMRFYTGSMFPAGFRNRIFIAEHGSWNRSTPIGYRISMVRLEGNRPAAYEVFADGWLQEGSAWGRPVDVEMLPDGSLLVSDDKAGAVYRISYRR